MRMRTIEIAVGTFVALGVTALFFLALQVSNLTALGRGATYEIKARFDNVGGLKERSPVKAAGVLVGRISSITYDKKTYESVVVMRMDQNYNTFPEDTGASIYTSGLLGEQYIGLEPGGAEEYLKEGSEIHLTQPALVLEQLIGQFLYSKAGEGAEEAASKPPAF